MKPIEPTNSVITPVDSQGTLALKDLYLTKDIKTTAGANLLRNYTAQYTSTVVKRLKKAGETIHSKVNCDAWAHGSSGENSDFGNTLNPWNLSYSPGGSSSGSAAIVASGAVSASMGTDTGGSIRLPASFCGVCGLKPTYGALSRFGIIAMSSSLDCPGFFATNIEDIERLYEIAQGKDRRDATSHSEGRQQYHAPKDTLTLGIPEEYFGEGLDPQVKASVMQAQSEFEKMGIGTKPVHLPHTKYGIGVYYLIQTTEVASNLGRYDGVRFGADRSAFGAEAKRRIMLGTFASQAGYSDKFYEKAAKVRTLIIQDFTQAFSQVDALLAPVSPTTAFELGSKTADPLQMYLSDVLTVNMNLAGVPALALPCGISNDQLPIGMQLIGPRWSEKLLFDLGKRYQAVTDWHTRRAVISE
jgi:aspartyl-tRNA(Asn)/glutamyl-tRNA(Gln) amidotransferase subunit A